MVRLDRSTYSARASNRRAFIPITPFQIRIISSKTEKNCSLIQVHATAVPRRRSTLVHRIAATPSYLFVACFRVHFPSNNIQLAGESAKTPRRPDDHSPIRACILCTSSIPLSSLQPKRMMSRHSCSNCRVTFIAPKMSCLIALRRRRRRRRTIDNDSAWKLLDW